MESVKGVVDASGSGTLVNEGHEYELTEWSASAVPIEEPEKVRSKARTFAVLLGLNVSRMDIQSGNFYSLSFHIALSFPVCTSIS